MRPPAWLACLAAVAASLAWAAAAGAQDITTFGPEPQDCGAVGKDYADSTCTTQTRLGTFHLSPHIAHAGDVITGTVARTCSRNDGMGGQTTCPIQWPSLATPSRTFNEKLGANSCGPEDSTCQWKVPKNVPTVPWEIVTVGITNDQGTGISKDYFAIVGSGKYAVSGHVLDANGKPIPGVDVHVAGGGKGARLKTDATGAYNAILDRGHYNVTPIGRNGVAFAAKASNDCASAGDFCRVNLNKDRVADFTGDSGQVLHLTFDPTGVDPTGLSGSTMLLTDTNVANVPVDNSKISFSPPSIAFPPLALVCSPSGRAYPDTLPSGAPIGGDFTRITDAAGQIKQTVMYGTTPGLAWPVTADVPDSVKASEHSTASLNVSGGPGAVDRSAIERDLKAALTRVNGRSDGLLTYGAAINDAKAQQTALAFLSYLKWDWTIDKSALFPSGVEFAPIHSADGTGAIVFYPGGTPREQVLSLGAAAAVWDTTPQSVLNLYPHGVYTPLQDKMPTLTDWTAAHGQPIAGSITPGPSEGLAYFGMPYPPPPGTTDSAGRIGASRYYSQCVAADRNGPVAVTVHSPVGVQLVPKGDPKSAVGYDAKGRPVVGTGFTERAPGGGPVTIVAPAGDYSVRMVGTGAGAATVVFWPAAGAPKTATFRVRRGATGTARLTGAGVGSATFGGHPLRLSRGLALRVSRLPKLRPGKRRALRVTARDQFGKPVVGASVAVSGGARGGGVTDTRGVARGTIVVGTRKGALVRLTVTAPGYATARSRARVARR